MPPLTDPTPPVREVSLRVSQLPALTGLRFVAAALVVAHHLAASTFLPAMPPLLGNLGVTFFFVLSGFILAYNYAGRFTDRSTVRRFWRARFARVWPLHVVTLGVSALYLHLIGVPLSTVIGRFAVNASLLHAWVPDETAYFSFNGPSWSISVEAFFYLLFPFLLAGLLRLPSPAAVLKAAALLWAAAACTLIAKMTFVGPNTTFDEWAFYISPVWRLGDFFIGMALGVWFVSAGRNQQLRSLGRVGVELAALAVPTAVVTALALLVSPDQAGVNIVLAPAVAVTVYVFAVATGPISGLLAHPVAVYLGEISYGVYMWHALLIGLAVRSTWFMGHPAVGAAIVVVGTIAISSISYHAFEQPVRRRITRSRARVDVISPRASLMSTPSALPSDAD